MHRGGGNSLKPSHNHGFSLIKAFNNLAPWGEKKFVSELKRTYKFQRGVNNVLDCHVNARNDVKRHTEDCSPKYRKVGKIYQCLTNVDKRLRNKCAIVCFGKKVLSLGRHKFEPVQHSETCETACRMAESKRSSETSYACERGLSHELINNEPSPEFLSDTVFSRFTSHFSLKQAGATHVALCDSVGSYFRHWCGAFTLAEVLITLGIIGVVAAMTMPALIANTKKSEISAKLKKFNTTMAQCVLLSEQDNGPAEEWSNPGEYDTFDLDYFFKTYLAPYIKYSSAELKTEYGSKRYYVYLLDGGYFYFQKGNCVDIVYDVNGSKKPNAHGRDIFRFLLCGSKSPEWCDGRHFCPMYSTSAHTREEKIQDCIKGDRGSGCTGLLEYDGWEFKKDYPIRL